MIEVVVGTYLGFLHRKLLKGETLLNIVAAVRQPCHHFGLESAMVWSNRSESNFYLHFVTKVFTQVETQFDGEVVTPRFHFH